MEHLISYRISDFMLFSRESYIAMLIEYNEWLWPGQIAFAIASLLIIYFVRKGGARLVFAIAGLAWIWTGAVFHLQHFTTINWAAKYLAWLFVLQGLTLLIVTPALRLRFRSGHSLQYRLGISVFLISAFVPLMWLRDYPWQSIAQFGWGAEMTAVGTLGLLLAMQGIRALFLFAPVLYLVVALIIETSWTSPLG